MKRHESNAHKLLKHKAISDLIDQGYTTWQEYRVFHKDKLFIVDVVGFKEGMSIAVECGKTPFNKIEILKEHFSKVIKYHYSSACNTKHFVGHLPPWNGIISTSKVQKNGYIQAPRGIFTDGDKVLWVVDNHGTVTLKKVG